MTGKYIWMMLFAACVSLTAACGNGSAVYEISGSAESGSGPEVTGESVEADSAEKTEAGTVFVYVCGAVCRPGVYELPSGSRVYEAVAAAGGMTEEADERSLNQAELLADGQQITVCTREEAASLPVPSGSGGAADGRINLNTATREQLMTLPGIGEVRADAILAYREQNGRFDSVEEIQQVEGIKGKVFEKIRDQIEV